MRAHIRRPQLSRTRAGNHPWLGFTAVLLLLAGLLAPLAPLPVAAAPATQDGSGNPPPLPTPVRVNVAGSFQTALGCPQDYDQSCQITDLADDDDDGIWTVLLPVPPGAYTFRVVVAADIERSLGNGGDPDANDIQLQVPPDATGVYFSYSTHSGRIRAEPVTQSVSLVTDIGLTVPMSPANGGGYEAFFDSPPGSYGYTVLVNDQPVAQDTVALDIAARVHIVVDDAGNTTTKETVESTIVEVTKTAGGQPQPGACFAVINPDNGNLLTQACDDGDGSSDGVTTLRAVNGLQRGNYDIVETLTPDGQSPAADQQGDLGPGTYQIAATAEGEGGDQPPAEETPDDGVQTDEPPIGQPPTEAPPTEEQPGGDGDEPTQGRIIVVLIDATDPSGDRPTSACFLLDFAIEVCDDDGDGDIVFDDVLEGTHTLTETVAPPGFAPIADIQFTSGPEGGRLEVPHDPDGSAPVDTPDEETPEPVETTEPVETPDVGFPPVEPGTGALDVFTQDESGDQVVGACFVLNPTNGSANSSVERCDADAGDPDAGERADGAADGVVRFDDVDSGDYRLDETVTPDGAAPVGGENVEIVAGQPSRVTVTYSAAAAETGALVILVTDDQGTPLGQTCFDLSGAAEFENICDQGNDGRLNIPDIAAGDYTVTQTAAADGFQPADPVENVNVPAGGTTELPIVNEDADADPTAIPEPTQPVEPTTEPPATTGAVRIETVGADGSPVGGACYSLLAADGSVADVCDNAPSSGGATVGDDDPNPGFILVQGLVEGDYGVTQTQTPPDTAPDTDTETASVAAGNLPVVRFVAAPVVETPEAPETGEVLVVVSAPDNGDVTGVQLQLDGPTTIGPVRDNEDGDSDDRDGRIVLQDVTAGDYTLTVLEVPDETEIPAPQPVNVLAGETTRVNLDLTAAAPDVAQLTLRTVDEENQPAGGACYTIVNPSGSFGPFCDDENGTGDGQVILTEVTPGEQVVTQTQPPADAGPATEVEQRITVEAGDDESLTFTSGPALGTVVITATDPGNAPAAGGCYSLVGPESRSACDGGDGDAAPDEAGVVRFTEIEPGDYDVVEDQAPAEFQPVATPGFVTVVAGETANVAFTNEPTPQTGSVAITVVDPQGTTIETIPGACFGLTGAAEIAAVCDNEAGDADPAAGVIRLDNAPGGLYTVTQTRAAEGFIADDGEPVEVIAGQVAAVQIFNAPTPPPVGSLVAIVQNAAGEPTGGACVTVTLGDDAATAIVICDNDGNDADAEAGRIRFDGLDVGSYTATVTTAPDGTVAGEPVSGDVTAEGVTEVTLTLGEAEPETGEARLEVRDNNGDLVAGGCLALATDGTDLGTFCDGDENDADPEEGIILLQDLAEGSYEAVQVEPALPDNTLAAAAGNTFTVAAGRRIVVVIIIILPTTTGDLVVTLRDDRNRALGGACFAVIGRDGGTAAEICDNDGVDGDGDEGRVRFDALANGTYTLRQTGAVPGYDPAGDQQVTINGVVTRITVRNNPTPQASGDLAVISVGDDGNALNGACYALIVGTETVAGPTCDNADGNDGTATFADIDAGAYTLHQTQAPNGEFGAAADRRVVVVAGIVTEVRVAHSRRTGQLLIRKVDAGGALLGGACFRLTPASGAPYQVCDDDASDRIGTAGLIYLQGLATGALLIEESATPSGYQPGAAQTITIEPGRRASVIFRNTLLPPPPQVGNLTVVKVDESGAALPGACFALLQGSATVAGPRCDGADGANDGLITFTGVAAVELTMRETRRPGAGYEPIADQTVTVVANDTVEVEVVNRLRPGRVLVRKFDGDGDPLQGACFDLAPDGRGPKCSDAAGQFLFENLRPGAYTLSETKAPNGYLPIDTDIDVTVNAGATAVVEVENELAPPPPDTGSIQVVKFYCPAGDAGEGVVFVDSSDPGSDRLARTAGCDPGNARFRLIAASGEGGLGDFSVGDDGVYQTTLRAGNYNLTELDPQFGGDQTESVTVGVNQLTTVVVLNFVAPPAPAPAAIAVRKYTCDPGFQGTIYADYVANCATEPALTNNVTFRLQGAATGRRVTGDTGQKGQTRFTNLPAGDYLLREEPPYLAQTTFAFCGLDPNAPSFGVVGNSVAVALRAGQTMTCSYFNVPDQLSETTGSIVVHKEACDAASYPAGFDWYGECEPHTTGIQFALARFEGDRFVPNSTGTTDANGLLRFDRLQPGTYELTEIGGSWCHAESDSVNARGEVVVRANGRANVYIFNCVDTKQPPNTGAGPLASVGGAGGGGLVAALSLTWPLLGAAGWRLRRGSRRAA